MFFGSFDALSNCFLVGRSIHCPLKSCFMIKCLNLKNPEVHNYFQYCIKFTTRVQTSNSWQGFGQHQWPHGNFVSHLDLRPGSCDSSCCHGSWKVENKHFNFNHFKRKFIRFVYFQVPSVAGALPRRLGRGSWSIEVGWSILESIKIFSIYTFFYKILEIVPISSKNIDFSCNMLIALFLIADNYTKSV